MQSSVDWIPGSRDPFKGGDVTAHVDVTMLGHVSFATAKLIINIIGAVLFVIV